MSLETALAALRQANRVDGLRASYRKDNPTEYLKVMAYLDGGARPAGADAFSFMGQGFVWIEDVRRGSAPPPPSNVVNIPAGNYGPLTAVSDKTYVLADGAVVGDVQIRPGVKNVELRSANPLGGKVGTVYIGSGSGASATDVVLRDLDGYTFEVGNSLRTRIYDCDWGPAVNKRPVIAMWSATERPIDVLVQGGWIHGMQASPPDNPDFHADGILMYCGNGIVVRGVTFGRTPAGVVDSNGGTGDLAIFYRTDPNFANILIENCVSYSKPWAAPGDASYNVQYDGKIYGLTFAGNTFPKGMLNTGPGANPPVSPPPNWPPS